VSRIVGKVRESISFCLRQSRIVVIVFARGTHKPQYKWHAREDCIYKETLFLLRVRYFAAICSKSQIDSSSWSNSRKRDFHPESISCLKKNRFCKSKIYIKKNGTPERIASTKKHCFFFECATSLLFVLKSQIDSSSWSNSRKRDSHPESISHLKKSILQKQNRPKKKWHAREDSNP